MAPIITLDVTGGPKSASSGKRIRSRDGLSAGGSRILANPTSSIMAAPILPPTRSSRVLTTIRDFARRLSAGSLHSTLRVNHRCALVV